MWSRTHSNTVKGFLWRKLVAEGVAKGMPAQTEQLFEKAGNDKAAHE